MKHYALLFVLTAMIVACSQEPEKPKETYVSGTIQNAQGDSVSFERFGDMQKFAVDSEGKFSGVLVGESGYYNFRYLRESTTLFSNPGDSLKIELDTRMFDESINYSGTSAKENNYLASKFLLKEDQGKKMNMRTLYSMSEDSFSMTVKNMLDEVAAALNKSEVSDEFKAIESSNLKYEAMANMQNYESYHQYFAQNDSFKVSSAFNEQFAQVDYTNEKDFNLIPEYRKMVLAHYSNDELKDCLVKLKDVESASIKDAVLERLTDWMSPGADSLSQRVETMKMLASTEELKKEIGDKFETMKMLTQGNNSPGFNFKNVEGQNVDLADLMGKNVYIDVWATWCGPCKAEIPHLKQLESDYHAKNIEFVSISVDVPADEQKWKDMVAEKELKGVQLISNNGWDTEFVESYLIQGIPRFILLDVKGKIVSADAPRPSSNTEIRTMIDKLMI